MAGEHLIDWTQVFGPAGSVIAALVVTLMVVIRAVQTGAWLPERYLKAALSERDEARALAKDYRHERNAALQQVIALTAQRDSAICIRCREELRMRT